MKEVILCKYGEVVLKGANRSEFEAKMLKELRKRARHVGNFNIFYLFFAFSLCLKLVALCAKIVKNQIWRQTNYDHNEICRFCLGNDLCTSRY